MIRKLFKDFRKKASVFLYNLSGRNKKNMEILQKLKDKHKGKRCFIICNGPSLLAEDLDMIAKNGDISFACNKIDRIFEQTDWRPTYYCVSDEGYQYSLLDTMNTIPAELKFFRKESFLTTCRVKSQCVWINADGNRKLLESPAFAEDVSEGVYAIATVTYVMLQIAVHMGIREIYIIGCDNFYGREKKADGTVINHETASYFKGSDSKDAKLVAATWEMNVAYDFARKYADAHGIKILNATRGGHLEAFQRVDFDTLF